MRRPPDQISLLDCAVLIAKHAYPQLVSICSLACAPADTCIASAQSRSRGLQLLRPRLCALPVVFATCARTPRAAVCLTVRQSREHCLMGGDCVWKRSQERV